MEGEADNNKLQVEEGDMLVFRCKDDKRTWFPTASVTTWNAFRSDMELANLQKLLLAIDNYNLTIVSLLQLKLN